MPILATMKYGVPVAVAAEEVVVVVVLVVLMVGAVVIGTSGPPGFGARALITAAKMKTIERLS